MAMNNSLNLLLLSNDLGAGKGTTEGERGNKKTVAKVRSSPAPLTVFPLHSLSLHPSPLFRTFAAVRVLFLGMF